MKRMRAIALLVVPLLALAGCSGLFDFNAFSALDKPAAPKLADYTATGGLDKLATDLGSPAVVDQLKADTGTTVADIETYLLTTYLSTPTITTAEQQQAAILYGEVYLKTTEAGSFVNSIVATMVNGIPAGSKIQDLLARILPPAALADPAVFSEMIVALLMANEQYLKLGDSIDRNSNGVFDTGDGLLLVGANVGDLAQKAAVAYTIKVVYEQIDAALPGVQTQSELIAQMYLLATAPTSADPLVQNLNPDPYATLPSGDAYVNANQPRLSLIFQCAGLSLP
jgi:hypothetical protein